MLSVSDILICQSISWEIFWVIFSIVIALALVSSVFLVRKLFMQNAECYEYNYNTCRGPVHWSQLFQAAGGQYQSPIHIETELILPIADGLRWTNYDQLPLAMNLTNDGHKIVLNVLQDCDRTASVSGANLLHNPYVFKSICFRWSMSDHKGTEHAIAYIKYALEMQVEHTYSAVNGIAYTLIISYFFRVTKEDNPLLNPIILNLRSVQKSYATKKIEPFPLEWLCPPFVADFYSYGGSRTDPPCTEGVTWFLQPQPLPISHSQLSEFRKMRNAENEIIRTNVRPIQSISRRTVVLNKLIANCRN